MRGSFAFVLLESSCWYDGWEEVWCKDEETSVMSVRREFKIRIVVKTVVWWRLMVDGWKEKHGVLSNLWFGISRAGAF